MKTIDLSGNRIQDESAKFICKAVSESNVEKLSLFKNRISEKAVDQIILVLKSSKYLKEIDFQENLIFSKTSKNKLKLGLSKAGFGGKGINILIWIFV